MNVIENFQRYYDMCSVPLKICTVTMAVRMMCRNCGIFRLGKKIGITAKSSKVNFTFFNLSVISSLKMHLQYRIF